MCYCFCRLFRDEFALPRFVFRHFIKAFRPLMYLTSANDVKLIKYKLLSMEYPDYFITLLWVKLHLWSLAQYVRL